MTDPWNQSENQHQKAPNRVQDGECPRYSRAAGESMGGGAPPGGQSQHCSAGGFAGRTTRARGETHPEAEGYLAGKMGKEDGGGVRECCLTVQFSGFEPENSKSFPPDCSTVEAGFGEWQSRGHGSQLGSFLSITSPTAMILGFWVLLLSHLLVCEGSRPGRLLGEGVTGDAAVIIPLGSNPLGCSWKTQHHPPSPQWPLGE